MLRFNDYLTQFSKVLKTTKCRDAYGKFMPVDQAHDVVLAELMLVKNRRQKVFVIGNGGSAAIASHFVTDLLKNANIAAATLTDPSQFSCFSNDYGYENAYAKMLQVQAMPGDLLIAISSSGQSDNMVNAAESMLALGGAVITLTGFDADNPLSETGDLNFWLNDHEYGFVEVGHQLLCHYWSDRLTAQVAEQVQEKTQYESLSDRRRGVYWQSPS